MAKDHMRSDAPLPPRTAEIFRRLDAAGLRQKDLADALHLEANKISKVRVGERQLKGEEIVRADEWLSEQEEKLARQPQPDLPPTVSASEGEMVEILSLDLSFSMGTGTTIDDYIEETPVKFDLGFLRSITRAPAERLRLARGIGDSMFPTLLSNDRVMIDTTQRVLNLGDRVWAVSLYGAAAIKRLRTIGPQRVLVVSDNPAVPDQEVEAEDLVIAGRVIWFSRDL